MKLKFNKFNNSYVFKPRSSLIENSIVILVIIKDIKKSGILLKINTITIFFLLLLIWFIYFYLEEFMNNLTDNTNVFD